MPSHDQICRTIIHERKVCILIPTYNNAGTLSRVLDGCLFYTKNIIVVDDGSSDSTNSILKRYDDITVIHHAVNQGKGMAINEVPAKEVGRMRDKLTRVNALIAANVGMELWTETQGALAALRK